jgi:hypothetical protein
MRKKTPKAKPADTLLKTHKKGEIELTEQELEKASGGRKAGKDQLEFLTITMKDVIIT